MIKAESSHKEKRTISKFIYFYFSLYLSLGLVVFRVWLKFVFMRSYQMYLQNLAPFLEVTLERLKYI